MAGKAKNAIEGFVTGFAGTLAPLILERKKEARDYFNKQVEYARTTGLENRNRAKAAADANLSVARQLEQVGVPRDVVMAQINQNPEGLADFYQNVDKINIQRAEKGMPPMSADEWKSLYKVSGNFKAPDEDLATFVSKTYDPIANAATSPSFSDNPEGSFWSSMMGFSAMDEARAELGQTTIAEGLTADQLIRYGDVKPQRVGGEAIVTTDYGAIPKEADDLSISESTALNKFVSESASSLSLELPPGADGTELREIIVEQTLQVYPNVPRERIEQMATVALTNRRLTFPSPTGETETAPTEPQGVPMGEDSPETQTPSVNLSGPLTAEEVGLAVSELGVASVVPDSDGISVVTMVDGTVHRMKTDELRDVIRQKTGQ